MSLRKCAFNFSHFFKTCDFSRNSTPLLVLHHVNGNSHLCKKKLSDSPKGSKKDRIPSTLSKYELFSEDATLDVEKERQKIISNDEALDEFHGINLQRGVGGIFDVEEIVGLLKKEKAEEIVVIKIPPEHKYADYMVIVNGRSRRHMLAMTDFIRRIYKRKVSANDHIPLIEGKNSNSWMALDLGNIILHVFSKSGREVYDLETLWTVGKDFDTLSQSKTATSVGLLTDYSKILDSLSPKT